ncbi:Bardet-Biedl syndrome 4 protein homolog [Anopheles ziemanni]|uniref:Bardet-Biedl syndrome 4 protein homolog n=1 Tax=Anopheles coustani TaxID=139045 RepID=UPI00265AB016|nr:Bardet-Biedl syndrome 4 protein homolog [Anopheles coustani]XP_058177871.1 Bardet-Biedl syndrome 4 protein homolog [Anopheles ziemanni]
MTDRYVYCNGRAHEATSSVGAGKQPSSTAAMKPQSVTNRHMNWLIHALYSRKHFVQCGKLIDRQLAICYDKEYLYYMKGLLLREENNATEATQCFQQAIALNRKEPENYKELAKTLYSMGKFKNALEVFLKAETLLERPDHEIYHHIGELYYKNFGQPKAGRGEAKEYLKQAITCGKHVASYKILAEIYIEEGDSIKAIEMIESCLQFTTIDVALMTQIGILYLKINEYQRAFEKLLDATATDSKHTSALLALGSILQSKNDIDGALNKYKRMSNLPEESSEVWSNIGLCFFKKQKFIAGISCLKKAAWISPLNFNALYNLGLVLVTAQQYVSAFQTLAAAISLRPEHAECYMLLGTCLRHLNDPGNAYLSLEKSTMLPDAIKNPLIYLNFALYCYEVGKSDQSVLHLSNFLEMTQHITVHREYLKMAERLNTALAMSARSHNLPVPETQRRPGDPDATEKDHQEADETLAASSEPKSGERRGAEDRSGTDGDLC